MALRPLGCKVPPSNALPPQKVIITGENVDLVPLQTKHFPGLWNSIGHPRYNESWTYMPEGPEPFPRGKDDFEANLRDKMFLEGAWFWCISVRRSEESSPSCTPSMHPEATRDGPGIEGTDGHVGLWRIDISNRVGEISHVMFGEGMRGAKESTEVSRKKLMFRLLISRGPLVHPHM